MPVQNAKIMDGAAVARRIREEIARRAAALTLGGCTPGLAVVLVGEDPASAVYVRNKVKSCEQCGIQSTLIQLPDSVSEASLLEHVESLSRDPAVHGILVQLPLPPHIDSHKVIEAIAAEKDVDGFHVSNAGALMTGKPAFRPCTPYGVMKLLEAYDVPLAGQHAVVIGRSNIVGKPLALLLLEAGATVTICHSKTRDLKTHTLSADIVVVAVGRQRLLTGDMLKRDATVIDVGVNRDADGKLCGDADFESVSSRARLVTPVPGGVGPMTITMLLSNTIDAAERAINDGLSTPRPAYEKRE